MSASDNVPTDIEASVLSSDLNSVILLIFLMGMYTVIYFGTIYVYLTKHPSKYHLVPGSITVLFFSSIAGTALQWYATKLEYIDNGDTRDSVFLALNNNPRWLFSAGDTLFYIAFVISDALLIWRCFFVWNRSWCFISAPLLLIVTEITLYVVQVAFNANENNLTASPALAATINDLLATAFFMSFATTLVTTLLIAYRIHSVSKQEGSSSRRFKHVIDIVVQSGAVYALSQLTGAIAGVIPGANTLNTRDWAFQAYTQSLNCAIAGISTTVMVARVALLADDVTFPSTSVHLSGLQFHARSTHSTINVATINITHSENGDSIAAAERHVVESKA